MVDEPIFEYSDVVCLEQTVDPPLHMLRRLLRRNKIKFVHDHNHGLVVNQFVQIGNDTALENGRKRGDYWKIHDVAHVQNQRMFLERDLVDDLLWSGNWNGFVLHLSTISQLQLDDKKTLTR